MSNMIENMIVEEILGRECCWFALKTLTLREFNGISTRFCRVCSKVRKARVRNVLDLQEVRYSSIQSSSIQRSSIQRSRFKSSNHNSAL